MRGFQKKLYKQCICLSKKKKTVHLWRMYILVLLVGINFRSTCNVHKQQDYRE
jgi:hypothetical protein